MIAVIILIVSVVAFAQFWVYYWRATMSGVAAQKAPYGAISVECCVLARRKCLRLDRRPGWLPKNIDGRTAESKICNVSAPDERREFDVGIR